MKTLAIKRNRVGPILGAHPWVFSQAFVAIPDGMKPGEPVRLVGEDGAFLAAGYFNSYSQITVRVWGYDRDEEVDEVFFIRRIERARAIRKRYVESDDTDSYRLIHGENDFLPGLIVDMYAGYLVVQLHTTGIDAWKGPIIGALEKVLAPKGIYERSDIAVRRIEGLKEAKGVLAGTVPDLVAIRENGLHFLVNIKEGQKTGFFLDQRDKRWALTKYTRDAEVLNCFSYTGGFSVYALAGGAKRVVNVDTSTPALDLARQNCVLNGFQNRDSAFVNDDVKDYLKGCNDSFDVIILDPPAFIKDRRKKAEGIKGYRKINEMALNLLNPGGILLTCSCSAHLSPEEFRFLLSEAAGKAQRPLTILEAFTHGIDHPQRLAYLEGQYLKCFILKT